MNFKHLWESLKNSGGASYNVNTGELNPTTGYMVATKGHEQKFSIPATFEEFKNYVRVFLFDRNTFDVLVDNENAFVGCWKHDNELYIDVVYNVKEFEEAYSRGFDNEQIAIYDCAKKRDITIVYLYTY